MRREIGFVSSDGRVGLGSFGAGGSVAELGSVGATRWPFGPGLGSLGAASVAPRR
jgi:hypothetical protein